MIPHFKAHTHIHTDKQHFDIKQASMIVQEKEPLSPLKKKGCKSLVICTLLLYPPAENIILTNLTTQRSSSIKRSSSIIHHPSLQTNKSLYDKHSASPPHSSLTLTQYSNT